MKNAKVLIPAIAALVLSSAAAVTGTVAWFTANLQATAETDKITVVKTSSTLNAALTSIPDEGTTGSASGPISHKNFIDGSVDLTKNPVDIVAPKFGTDGSTISSFEKVVAKYGENQFRATHFTIDLSLTLENPLTTDVYSIYVDRPSFVIAATQNKTAEKALRVGLKTASNYLVWAPYDGAKTSLPYVPVGTTAGNKQENLEYNAAYDANHIIKDGDTTIATGSEARAANLKLGEYTAAAHTPLKVEVYTWFEGAVIDDNSVLRTTPANYTLAFNAVKTA